jgi:rhamnose transport system permease protein
VRERSALLALLAIEIALFALTGENFATAANALEIVRASCELGLLALATTLVLSAGSIDLSIGSVMGLAGIVLGGLHAHGWPIELAGVAALGAGVACGLVNGLAVGWLGVPPLLATLATMALYRGVAEGLTGGYAVYTSFPARFLYFGQGYAFGFLPPQLPLLALVAAAVWMLAHRMPFGRRLAAIGYSPSAALHAGVPLRRDRLVVHLVSGGAAALAGILYVAHLGQAKADAGTGYELVAITVVALGGTSIFGGERTVAGSLLALFAISVLQDGLLLAGQPSELGSILMGLLLVAAVLLHRRRGTALWRILGPGPSPLPDSDSLDMTARQLFLLVCSILAGALVIAFSNARAMRGLADEVRELGGEVRRSAADGGARSNKTLAPTRVTVAMLPKNKSDPYFVSCRQGAEEAARELGVELLWDGPAETDAARQNVLVEAWITRGVDVIAASVENSAAISTVLRKARERGIRVLTWDADAEKDARDFLVNQATPQGIGEALADEAGRVLGGKGSFAIVTASLTAANQQAWIEHIRARLAERWPELSIAVIRPSDGLRDKALVETKNILHAYSDVRLIVTIAAAAVPGSAEAVKQEGSTVKVIGLSVPSLCRDYVHQGIIECIVLWNTVDLGYLTVHASRALASGALAAGTHEIEAGRLGKIEIRGDEILLGKPFRFDAKNIDQYDF